MNLSRYWTNSIEWQEDSSGGQSPKNYIKQWSHELSDPDIESGESTIHSLFEPGTVYAIEINVAGSNRAMLGRILGFVMISIMPDEGLEEALFSLRDMFEFYSHKPTPRLARLAPKAIDASIGDKKKRPDLVLTE